MHRGLLLDKPASDGSLFRHSSRLRNGPIYSPSGSRARATTTRLHATQSTLFETNFGAGSTYSGATIWEPQTSFFSSAPRRGRSLHGRSYSPKRQKGFQGPHSWHGDLLQRKLGHLPSLFDRHLPLTLWPGQWPHQPRPLTKGRSASPHAQTLPKREEARPLHSNSGGNTRRGPPGVPTNAETPSPGPRARLILPPKCVDTSRPGTPPPAGLSPRRG